VDESDRKIVLQLADPPCLPVWAAAGETPVAGGGFGQRAENAYEAAWEDANLLSFTADGPLSSTTRPVSAATGGSCGRRRLDGLPRRRPPRDRSRQARHPLAPTLSAAGFERGHLGSRAAGGGVDASLFP